MLSEDMGYWFCRCVRLIASAAGLWPPSWAALMSSGSGGRKLPADGLIVRVHFVSDFFVLLFVRLAASGRGRGSGTSLSGFAAACSPCSPAWSVGGADAACAGGGSRRSHWQSL